MSSPSESSPPWQAWTLDQDFLRQFYEWNESHPENTLDRILNDICTSIDRHKDLMGLVPDGPIPFRGFAKALAHLMKLGAVICLVSSSRQYTKFGSYVDCYCGESYRTSICTRYFTLG
jgi:hypothetical protein